MEHLPYHVLHFGERINLKPHQLKDEIDSVIKAVTASKLEGKCTKFGYIRYNNVIVISRSVGYQKSCHFNGEMTFDVEIVADVCKPLRGDIIFCTVFNINRMGLLAKSGEENEVHIYVVAQHHNNSVFFEDPRLVEQAHLSIEVVGSKAKLNDDKIIVVGKIIKIFNDNELENYAFKIAMLPHIQELCGHAQKSWDLEISDAPPELKASLGYQGYISNLKSLLGRTQADFRVETLRAISHDQYEDSVQLITDDVERNLNRTSNLIRSLTNEFEMVHPPLLYDKRDLFFSKVERPISRAFYKLWEMIVDFDLLPSASSGGQQKIITAHIAESPGSFAEACIRFRDSGKPSYDAMHPKHVSDEMFIMSLKHSQPQVPGIPAASLLDTLSSKYPYPFVHVIYGGNTDKLSNVPSGYKTRQGNGTGDIFKLGNILDFSADVIDAGSADFVTSDLGFEFENIEDLREQSMLFPIFAQICTILSVQKKNGHCILKIFDIFSKITVKLISFLTQYYKESYITKPFTSRSGNPEKYIVCKNFIGISRKDLLDAYKIYETWQSIEPFRGAEYPKNSNFVTDVNTNKLNSETMEIIFKFNQVNVAQRQIRTISNMIHLLRHHFTKNELSEEVITNIKNQQIQAAKSWFRKYMSFISSI